jgi:hypothetical protein
MEENEDQSLKTPLERLQFKLFRNADKIKKNNYPYSSLDEFDNKTLRTYLVRAASLEVKNFIESILKDREENSRKEHIEKITKWNILGGLIGGSLFTAAVKLVENLDKIQQAVLNLFK